MGSFRSSSKKRTPTAITEPTQKERLMLAVSVHLLLILTTSAEITVQPKSTSVLVGEDATLSCAGESLNLFWTVDGENAIDLGYEPTNEEVDGIRISNLTITGSVENNNISIQCIIVIPGSSFITISPVVFLTVLGIGVVPYVTLSQTSSCIQWKEPAFVSADVTDLMYNVSVDGTDLPPSTFTTHHTQYCLELTPCLEYNITVTPFSTFPDYVGASNSTRATINGVNPTLEGPCKIEIRYTDNKYVTSLFTCKVMKQENSCLLQRLEIEIGSYIDGAVQTFERNFSEGLVNNPIEESFPDLPAGEKCYSDFTLIDLYGIAVSILNANFTTYSVQSAKFTTVGSNSVKVTCFFAINAPASKCLAVFINSSLELSFNGSVAHSLPQSTGLINIPETILQHEVIQRLESVAFTAKVYDMNMDEIMEDYPAYEQEEALMVHVQTALSTDISTNSIVSSTIGTPHISPEENGTPVGTLLTVVAASVVVVLFLLVALFLMMACYFKYKQKRGEKEATTLAGILYVYDTNNSRIPANDNSLENLDAHMEPVVNSKADDNIVSVDSGTKPRREVYEQVQVQPSQLPTGESHYTQLCPRPLDAPAILHDLDGVQYTTIKKHATEYAELGDRPADAPTVLPPDRPVHYVQVRPASETKATFLKEEPTCTSFAVFSQGTTTSCGLERTIFADTKPSVNLMVDTTTPPQVPRKPAHLASRKTASPEECMETLELSDSPHLLMEDKNNDLNQWEKYAEPEMRTTETTSDMPMGDHELLPATATKEIMRGHGHTASESSFAIIRESQPSDSSSSSSCNAENAASMTTFAVNSVPSFVQKVNNEERNCFESLEQSEEELNHSILESQSEECNYKMSGDPLVMGIHSEMELCLMTSEGFCQEEASSEGAKLIFISNLSDCRIVNCSPCMPHG